MLLDLYASSSKTEEHYRWSAEEKEMAEYDDSCDEPREETGTSVNNLAMRMSEITFDATLAPGSKPRYMDDSFGLLSSSTRFDPSVTKTLPEDTLTLVPPKRWSSQGTVPDGPSPQAAALDDSSVGLESSGQERIERFQSTLQDHDDAHKSNFLVPPQRCSSHSRLSNGAASTNSSFNSSFTMEMAMDELKGQHQDHHHHHHHHNHNHNASHLRFSRRLTPIADELADIVVSSDLDNESSSSIAEIEDTAAVSRFPSDRNVFQGEASYDLDFGFESFTDFPVGPMVETRSDWGTRSSITLEAALLGDSSLIQSPVGPVVETRKSWGVGSSLTLSSALDDSNVQYASFSLGRQSSDRFDGSPVRLENKGLVPPPPPRAMNGLRFSSESSPPKPQGAKSLRHLAPCPKPVRLSSGGRKSKSSESLSPPRPGGRSPRRKSHSLRSQKTSSHGTPTRLASFSEESPVLPQRQSSDHQQSSSNRLSTSRHSTLDRGTQHTFDTAATIPSRRESVDTSQSNVSFTSFSSSQQ